MKTFINSKYMKWFRRRFLMYVYKEIINNKATYCCNVSCIYNIFIPFNHLKEVVENNNSIYLIYAVIGKDLKEYRNSAWFINRQNRLTFLTQCLIKFHEN